MSADPELDRWYAARHARVVLQPRHTLETFGNTLVNYHLLSVLDDHPGKVRIREGRLESRKPLVITPDFSEITVEGMGEEAREYLEFLKANERYFRILRYGYALKSDNFSEQIVTDSLAAVTERVKAAVLGERDLFGAVVQGVDDPWDVALVELWRREVDRSAGRHLRELDAKGELFGKED